MESEDVLFNTIGGFGCYQKIQFVIVSLLSASTVEVLHFNFIAFTPDHWCQTDVQDTIGQNLSILEIRNLTIPWDSRNNRYSRCTHYDLHQEAEMPSEIFSSHSSWPDHNNSVIKCNNWNFDGSIFSHTLITEWKMVCDKAWLVDFLSMSHVFGFLVGSLIASLVSDRFGRWTGTTIFLVMKCIGAVMSILSPSYVVFLISRFLLGIGGIGGYLASFVLVLETTSPKHRTWMGVVLPLMFSFGSMFFGGFAYFVRDWRYVQLASVIPSIILTVLAIFFMNESPRWLIQRGNTKKGFAILRKIGKINKKPFFEKVETTADVLLKKEPVSSPKKVSVIKLFVTPAIRRYTFVCIAAWCSASLIFYALSMNAKSLSGNIFLNFFLLSVVEVPANLLALFCLGTKLLGRKYTQISAFMLAGVACFVSVPLIAVHGKSHITTALAMVGKFGATAAFSCIYVYTAELFPTEIRNVAIGVGSLASRVGSLLAPYTGGSMGQVWTPLPSLIFGIAGTVSSLLILLLPETRGTVLKDTVEEQEVVDLKKTKKPDQETC